MATAATTANPFAILLSTAASTSSSTPVDTPTSDTASPTSSSSDKPTPNLRLQIHDLAHPGTRRFFAAIDPVQILGAAVPTVLARLYPATQHPVPEVRSITLVLRDMPGIAHTTANQLDSAHKEIHLSLRYVAGLSAATDVPHEIRGVVLHEVVHCLQHNGRGACPVGLTEGIADFVRLRAGLAPPHWTRPQPGQADYGRWDAGYQQTAYFLDFLDSTCTKTDTSHNIAARINNALSSDKYVEATFWPNLLGKSIQDLWKDYVDAIQQTKSS